MKETVYHPTHADVKVFALGNMYRDLLLSRFLGRQLFVRDTLATFRQSLLGLFWAFIPPFFTASVWIFLTLFNLVKVNNTVENYPVFVLCGTIMFQTFFEALKAPTEAVMNGRSMMSKLKFPREAFLISAFYRMLFNFLARFVALVLLLVVFSNSFSWNSLLFIPAALALILCGFSIGVLLIPFQMLYEDFGRFLAIASQVVMYITPVVYPMPESGRLYHFMLWNPITPLITVTRDLLTGQYPTMWPQFTAIMLCSLLILWIGWAMYRITMPIIIERIGS